MAVGRKKRISDVCAAWENRIVRGYKARYAHSQRWKLLLEYYKGNYLPPGKLSDDAVVVNWVLSNIRQMLAALYFQNPRFFIQGLTPRGTIVAPIVEGVYRLERNIINAPSVERDALFNALLYGTGIIKHGFNAQYAQENPWRSTGVPKSDKDTEEAIFPSGTMTEYSQVSRNGHAWKASIPPFNFLSDPEATRPEEARWFTHIFNRPWIDCVQDERWDRTQRELLDPTGKSEWSLHQDSVETKPSADDEDSSLVTLYEVWDRPSQTMFVWAAGLEQPLYAQRFPYFGPTGPYHFLQFFPTGDGFWAMPYAWTFAGQAEVMNKVRTQMFDHLQRWGVVRGAFLQGAISKEDAAKFMRNANALTEVRPWSDKSINEIFQIFPYVPINADVWQLQSLFQQDMDQVSGIDEMTRGGGQGINLATVANYVQQQAGLRQSDLRHMVENFLTRSARHDITMLRTFWGADRVVPIFGDDGLVWNSAVLTEEEINYEFEIHVEPGSTERIDRVMRARQANEAMAQLVNLMPLLQQSGYTVDWPKLVKTYLHNADFMENADSIVVPLPPPPPMPMGLPAPQQGPAQIASGMQSQTPAPQNVTMQGGQNPQMQGSTFDLGRMLSEGAQ